MLEAYAVNQTITSSSPVPFTSVSLLKGQTAVLSGSASVQLNRCGVYSLSAIVTGVPAAAGTASIQATKNGVPLPEATASDTAALTTAGVTLPIHTLIQVRENNGPCCCQAATTVQILNTGVGLNTANTSLVVTKVC